MGVSSAGVARRAKEGIGGPSSRGLFRKWGAQGKSRLTGPESWTLWCADIRSCTLDGVFCVQCVVVWCSKRAVQGRALRAGLRRVAGSRQSAGRRLALAEGARSRRRANWRCGEGRDSAARGRLALVLVLVWLCGVSCVWEEQQYFVAVAVGAVGRRGFTGADGTFDD